MRHLATSRVFRCRNGARYTLPFVLRFNDDLGRLNVKTQTLGTV
jgi:hypothetical protein